MLMVALTSRLEPEDTKNITWLYLPAARGQIERAMERSGIADPDDMRFRFVESMFPDEVDVALDFRRESIYELNELSLAVNRFSDADQKKLGAVVAMAKPECAVQIRHLAENLDQFEFAPGWAIRQSLLIGSSCGLVLTMPWHSIPPTWMSY